MDLPGGERGASSKVDMYGPGIQGAFVNEYDKGTVTGPPRDAHAPVLALQDVIPPFDRAVGRIMELLMADLFHTFFSLANW